MSTPHLLRAVAVGATMVLAGCGESTPAPSTPTTTAAAPAAAKEAPVPPRVKGQNPFAGGKFYINEYNQAAQAAQALSGSRPADAKLLEKIAKQPVAVWYGEWTGEVEPAAFNLGQVANRDGNVPVVVLYNVPNRDCGQYSAGGVKSPEAYIKWIKAFVKGAGSYHFIVILEPDALGLLTKCLSPADQKARLDMMHEAVKLMEATPGIAVYIDAGNVNWMPAAEMAKRLVDAGVADADGFSLNVSNYFATDITIKYGHDISQAVGGKHFVIDTGRNGNGATKDAEWCNPEGRAVGTPPTSQTGDPLIDAFFWFKPPGESDGTCHGGPKAGEFFPDQAIGMIKRAKWAQ